MQDGILIAIQLFVCMKISMCWSGSLRVSLMVNLEKTCMIVMNMPTFTVIIQHAKTVETHSSNQQLLMQFQVEEISDMVSHSTVRIRS